MRSECGRRSFRSRDGPSWWNVAKDDRDDFRVSALGSQNLAQPNFMTHNTLPYA
jgi:hypothetical protein